MFEHNTHEAVLSGMLGRIPAGISKHEGTFTYDVSSAFAVELAMAYTQLDRLLRLGFAGSSSGIYLDMRANEHGLTRKAAVKAYGQITVTGSNGAVVPQGTVFATATGTRFTTLTAVTIPAGGSAAVSVEAEKAGSTGNAAAGTVTQIPVSVAGISMVTNGLPLTGGYDAEDDAGLLGRLLLRVRNPSTSGNAAHYKQWAMESEGIGDAQVFPLWNGPGTVKVVLLTPDKRAPSADAVNTAAAYIGQERPVGAAVTVAAATEVPINVSVDVALSGGGTLAGVKSAVENGLREYLKSLAFADPVVRYTRIANIILDTAGVQDYTALTVNGGTGNIAVAEGSAAVLGMVAVT
ncbi:MAG: Baseplate family protein [Paenibacillaceae bacterium]|jgi:uncharacterized phage protein gp47/JayE|nr:Baseplate family protein [Paenibacillaceae bacterium]